MVGRLPDAARAGRLGFAAEGDAIALVGAFAPSAVGSELAKLQGAAPAGPLPPTDVQAVRDAHEAVRIAVNLGALHNAHDIAEGGIAVALAECCIAGGIGARVRLPEGLAPFGEAPGRAFVVSGRRGRAGRLSDDRPSRRRRARARGVAERSQFPSCTRRGSADSRGSCETRC